MLIWFTLLLVYLGKRCGSHKGEVMKIVISSGHGKYISGAVGPSPWGIHEHTEAVKVVNEAAAVMRSMGVDVITYEDTVSTSQNENLDRICDYHNAQGNHDLDV